MTRKGFVRLLNKLIGLFLSVLVAYLGYLALLYFKDLYDFHQFQAIRDYTTQFNKFHIAWLVDVMGITSFLVLLFLGLKAINNILFNTIIIKWQHLILVCWASLWICGLLAVIQLPYYTYGYFGYFLVDFPANILGRIAAIVIFITLTLVLLLTLQHQIMNALRNMKTTFVDLFHAVKNLFQGNKEKVESWIDIAVNEDTIELNDFSNAESPEQKVESDPIFFTSNPAEKAIDTMEEQFDINDLIDAEPMEMNTNNEEHNVEINPIAEDKDIEISIKEEEPIVNIVQPSIDTNIDPLSQLEQMRQLLKNKKQNIQSQDEQPNKKIMD